DRGFCQLSSIIARRAKLVICRRRGADGTERPEICRLAFWQISFLFCIQGLKNQEKSAVAEKLRKKLLLKPGKCFFSEGHDKKAGLPQSGQVSLFQELTEHTFGTIIMKTNICSF